MEHPGRAHAPSFLTKHSKALSREKPASRLGGEENDEAVGAVLVANEGKRVKNVNKRRSAIRPDRPFSGLRNLSVK